MTGPGTKARRGRGRRLGAVVLLALGCGEGSWTEVSPPAAPATALTVVLRPVAGDAPVAEALGWSGGIPGAVVRLVPADSTATIRTGVSDGAGAVEFGVVAAGAYVVEATRWLTGAEQAGVSGVVGWVGKEAVTVAGGAPVVVELGASRRGALVISEWAFNHAGFPGFGDYQFGGYLELFNNADTTIYLDGMVVADGLALSYDYPTYGCADYAWSWDDPAGVWSERMAQFPGRGRDYPVAPGGLVVVATDAIDHRAIVPLGLGLDLRGAEFEFWGGPGDVDNPAVPNMVDTLSPGPSLLGHGLTFSGFGQVVALSQPPGGQPLTRQPDPRTGRAYLRLPSAGLLDVITIATNYDSGRSLCPRLVHLSIDRRMSSARTPGELTEYEYSVSRRAVPLSVTGRTLLQVTRNSDADLFRTRRSPKALP